MARCGGWPADLADATLLLFFDKFNSMRFLSWLIDFCQGNWVSAEVDVIWKLLLDKFRYFKFLNCEMSKHDWLLSWLLDKFSNVTIDSLTSLNFFYLTENQLAYLDWNAFTKLKQIKSLYLDKNKLTSLPVWKACEFIFILSGNTREYLQWSSWFRITCQIINWNHLMRRFDELERTKFGI